MESGDVNVLAAVLTRAYASHQNFRWRLHTYAQMRALATFVAEVDGQPVGMVVGNDYGSTAYVSQMAVDPPLHRRGIGTALMDALVAWADRRGFPTVELDATPVGVPLYARYGFVTAAETLVYLSTTSGGSARGVRRYEPADCEEVYALDARAFGADRSDVLRALLRAPRTVAYVRSAATEIAGYAVAQPQTDLLGPVVAADAAAAASLVDAARTHLPALHRLSIPSDNPAARTIVAERGYRFGRSLEHMVRGVPPRGERAALFARINLGQG